jgi:hypothetical protein
MSSNEDSPKGVSDSDGWRAHELSQLRRFRALSLRQKLEAVEGMADVVRRLNQMRREGKFRTASPSPKPRETTKKQAVGEPPAIYQRAPVSDDLELAGAADGPRKSLQCCKWRRKRRIRDMNCRRLLESKTANIFARHILNPYCLPAGWSEPFPITREAACSGTGRPRRVVKPWGRWEGRREGLKGNGEKSPRNFEIVK